MRQSLSSTVADIARDLHIKGMDMVVPFCAQMYNTSCRIGPTAHLPPLPTFGRTNTLALLVGNSKHLWPIFLSHVRNHKEEVASSNNPLDEYIVASVESAVNAHAIQTDIRYTFDVGDKFVHFQRLAHESGAAYFNKTLFLCIHPVWGPWKAFRAVIVFDLDFHEAIWDVLQQPKPSEIPLRNPIPDLQDAIEKELKLFYSSGDGYESREWRYLVSARDAATSKDAVQFRYSDGQIQYHYSKNKQALFDDT
ncbi:hypothetical protein HDU84_007777 [Entophlyctis sp. JEL0112]|nr:hypothetical protein HDU84_007777 [Entophlyctis sp. JEL0112]